MLIILHFTIIFFYLFFFYCYGDHRDLHVLTHSFPTQRSSDLGFGVHATEQAESAGGIQKVVAGVVAKLADQTADEISVARLVEIAAAEAGFVGRDQFGAIGPGPALLPDRRRFPRDAAGKQRGIALEGGIVAPPRFQGQKDGAIALAGIGAAEGSADRLFLGAEYAGETQRAFGRKQVAMLPCALQAEALAGAEAGDRKSTRLNS